MRTTQQIKAEMDTVQATIPELAELNSTSNVAYFRLLKDMWALLVQMVEGSWERLQAEINTLLDAKRIGSVEWYAEQAKLFQMGDAVAVVDGKAGYDVVDPSKRIVVQSACIEDLTTGRLLLKVVKAPSINLSAEEIQAFRAYINQIKFAGVVVDVVSLRADQIKVTATVEYDRQILAANGSLLTDNTKFPVVDALRAYLASLPFDSVVSWTGITDYMQKVAGVKDFVITATEIAPHATNAFAVWSREVVSYAGHCELVGSGTLTYV